MINLRNTLLLMLVICTTSALADSAWQKVDVKNGEVMGVTRKFGTKAHTPDPAKNEYPVGYSFPQTNMMYWKKSGDDWVVMTAGEQTAKDAITKQETTVTASADVDMDALFQTIADAVKGNLKTKPEIIAVFKDAVDPKKADKKNKEKNK